MNIARCCPAILLFALLARPALAAPGIATLISPSGDVVGTTLAFSWQAAPESTWYLFWLGKGTPTAFIMEQWYSADQAGCASGGTCTITITPPMNAGSHTWFIRTWGAGLEGPWSTGKQFALKDPAPTWSSKLPDTRRFTLVLDDQGVLDNETGLVWQRTPAATLVQWSAAQDLCTAAASGQRFGWRTPTLSELRSLVDLIQRNPALPAGHPFIGIVDFFWTQTVSTQVSTSYYLVSFNSGGYAPYSNAPAYAYRAWCVRAASAGGQ